MKVILSILLVFSLFTMSCTDKSEKPPKTDTTELTTEDNLRGTVYITKSGTKYHKEDCQHLRKSKIAISKKEALERDLEPCKVCKP